VIRAYDNDKRLSENDDQRRKAVKDALKSALDVYRAEIKIIDTRQFCAGQPQQPQCDDLEKMKGAFSSATSVAGRQLSEENGFTKDQIDNIYSRQQTVGYAWLRPVEAGKEALSYWLALDQNSLRIHIDAMQQLCTAFGYDSGVLETRLRKVLRDLAAQLGNSDEISDHDTLATLLSLPFWERQAILSLNWKVIVSTIQRRDEQLLSLWRRAFCTSARLLLEVQNGRLAGDINQIRLNDRYEFDVPVGFWKKYDWLVTNVGGEKLYYIPYEYFPTDHPPDMRGK
jgi:hypothetical protein